MEFTERQQEILQTVHAVGYSSIEGLAERYSISPQTIRRDVNALCMAGALRRVHGGVEPPADGHNILYSSRRVLNGVQKHRIARSVAAYVQDGTSIAVSIGTTPEIVMQELGARTDLTVLTNNLNIAMAGCEREGWLVKVPGGTLRPGDRDILGPATQDFFAQYQVDIGIFGVGGVAEDGTLLDFTEDEVASRIAILRNCRRSFLVLDRAKFGRAAHVRGGHISDVTDVFCDAALPQGIASLLQGTGTRVTISQNEVAA